MHASIARSYSLYYVSWPWYNICSCSSFFIHCGTENGVDFLPTTKALEHLAHQVINTNVSNLTDQIRPLFLPRIATKYGLLSAVSSYFPDHKQQGVRCSTYAIQECVETLMNGENLCEVVL